MKLTNDNPVAHTIIMWTRLAPDMKLMCVCVRPEGGVIAVFAQPVLDDAPVKICNALLTTTDDNDLFAAGYAFSTIRASQVVKNDELDFEGADWNKAHHHLCSEYDGYLSFWKNGLPDHVTKAFMQGMDIYRRKLITEYL